MALPRRFVALLVLFGLSCALFLRVRSAGEVFLDPQAGMVLPFDPDSTLHLFRIEEAALTKSLPPRFDPFVNAPQGAHVLLPDGFDALLGILAQILSPLLFGQTNRLSVQVISLIFLPLMGVLSAYLCFAYTRRIHGTLAALVALALAAVVPAHVLPSILGRVDHHIVELMVPPLACLLLASTAEGAPVRRNGLLAGGLIAWLIYCLPAAALHAAVVGGSAVALALLCRFKKGDPTASSRLLSATALSFLVAFVLTFPDALSRGLSSLGHDVPSALSTWLCLFGAGAAWVLRFTDEKNRLPLGLGGVCAVGLLVAGMLLKNAMGYIGGVGMLPGISEAMPIWRQPLQALQLNSPLMPLFPVFLVWLAWRSENPLVWMNGIVGILGFVLTCLQVRFNVLLAIPAACATGGVLIALFSGERSRARTMVQALGVVFLVVGLAVPLRQVLRQGLFDSRDVAMLLAAKWLEQNSPEQGPRRLPNRGSYSTLTMWDYGNHLSYLANRPVVIGASPFGEYEPGLKDALAILFSDEDIEPKIALRKVRYLVLPAMPFVMELAHRKLLSLPAPKAPPLYGHLSLFDGSSLPAKDQTMEPLPARGHYRLRYVSKVAIAVDGRKVPAVKIFEWVQGAVVEGPCEGEGRLVELRHQRFVTSMRCKNGRFALRMPYSGKVESVVSAGAPLAPVTRSLELSEDEVILGKTRSL